MKYQIDFQVSGSGNGNMLGISKLRLVNDQLEAEDVVELKGIINLNISGEIEFAEGDVIMMDNERGAFVYHVTDGKMQEIGKTSNFDSFRAAEEILKQQKDLEVKRRMKEMYGDAYTVDRV